MNRKMTITFLALNLLLGLLLSATTTRAQGCATPSFGAATNFGVGRAPISVAVGDFNGDGQPDLATANFFSNNVSVLLGNGAGGFGGATNFGAGDFPQSVAVGDFNGDGKPDLATANEDSNNVSVLLGNGDGSFGAATNFGVGITPDSVAVGDFNGDGKPDLAVANYNSGNVSVLLGNGMGGFGAATNFGAGAGPSSVAVGDFNGDGQPDLAVANQASANVSVLLGNGMGGFGAATNFGAGTGPRSVAVGDFNGDGQPDLAVANQASANVSVLLGNGAGSFGAATNFGVGDAPRSVAVGDFNGDGKPDLATANGNSNNVSVRLGNGMGGFGAATSLGAGISPSSVAVGDFNGDGKPDLAVANTDSDNVSVLLNTTPPCNTAPTITAASVTRTAGAAASSAAIATVNDAEDAENTLSVTATLATGSGVTLTGISTDSSGNVTANIAADCTATNSTFTLQVTDSGGLSASTTLTVTVNANQLPVLSYPSNPGTVYGTAITVTPLTGPSDDLGVTSVVVQSITPSNPGGITVNSSGIVTVANNVPAGTYTVTIRANAACGNKDASFSLFIAKAASIITWSNPANITYGTALSGAQLNATANVAGSFVYTPAAGTVLNAGNGQTLSVNFTPSDTANYNASSRSVLINVAKATPVIGWNNPANITCNTPLGATQLNATANVAGSFVYTPPAGTILSLGSGQTLSVNFTPIDTTNYNTASRSVTINVLDTTAPTLTLKSKLTFWPPDHMYRSITMSQMVQSVSDGCTNTLGIGNVVIEKVTSDEPDDVVGTADGITTNDILIAADCKSVQLRSERNETLNGRVYLITLRVKDASGNTTRKDFKVSVPISQNGTAAVQDATAQTKTSVCP